MTNYFVSFRGVLSLFSLMSSSLAFAQLSGIVEGGQGAFWAPQSSKSSWTSVQKSIESSVSGRLLKGPEHSDNTAFNSMIVSQNLKSDSKILHKFMETLSSESTGGKNLLRRIFQYTTKELLNQGSTRRIRAGLLATATAVKSAQNMIGTVNEIGPLSQEGMSVSSKEVLAGVSSLTGSTKKLAPFTKAVGYMDKVKKYTPDFDNTLTNDTENQTRSRMIASNPTLSTLRAWPKNNFYIQAAQILQTQHHPIFGHIRPKAP